MKRSAGFTVIELMSALVLIVGLGVLAIIAKNNLDASNRDITRKTAVNAFYYGLKEAYFKTNNSYPASLSSQNLPSIDPNLFKDPEGRMIGQPNADYHYQGKNCSGNSCQGFTVSARLEKEATYIRSSSDSSNR